MAAGAVSAAHCDVCPTHGSAKGPDRSPAVWRSPRSRITGCSSHRWAGAGILRRARRWLSAQVLLDGRLQGGSTRSATRVAFFDAVVAAAAEFPASAPSTAAAAPFTSGGQGEGTNPNVLHIKPLGVRNEGCLRQAVADDTHLRARCLSTDTESSSAIRNAG